MILGTHTHFAQSFPPALIPVLAKAGIKHIRDEQYWAAIEKSKGLFNFPAKFTDYMAKATAAGIEPCICLTWSNPFYDYEAGVYTAPHTDAGRAGYANYVLQVLDKYPQIRAIEIWNEYNAGTFIKGPAIANKPLYYYLMLRKVYETIKPKFPKVLVVAGATVPVAHGFLKALFAQGALPYFDAVSVHYPADIEIEISFVNELIRAAGGKSKQIWVTEFSHFTKNDADWPNAASYIAQSCALMAYAGVYRAYYYLGMDYGSFPFMGLFGSVAAGFKEHPAGTALKTAEKQFAGARWPARLATSPSVYALRFYRINTPFSVLWSVRPITVQLATSGALAVTDQMGRKSTLTSVNGKVEILLTKDVIYVEGLITSVTEIGNDLLADSISGYSRIAGKNGWTYGYANVPGTYNVLLFKPLTWAIWGSDGYRWIRVGASYPFANGRQMHPDANWVIRRWVSNYAGLVKLEGNLLRGAGGDGVGIRIFVDGFEVYNRRLMPGQAISYSIQVLLSVGSKVDFTVNRWLESSFDATGFTSQIIKV